METLFEPVTFNVDEVVDHLRLDSLSEEDKGLILELKLPGTGSLFDSNPTTARNAAREFLSSFLMPGSDRGRGRSLL
jgi:hypothetical protein